MKERGDVTEAALWANLDAQWCLRIILDICKLTNGTLVLCWAQDLMALSEAEANDSVSIENLKFSTRRSSVTSALRKIDFPVGVNLGRNQNLK